MKTPFTILALWITALAVAAVSIPLPLVSSKRPSSSTSALNTSLISYWKLDEASGTRSDSEPTGTAQTLSDNFTVNQTNGVINSAAWFIASNSESLSRADSSDLSVSGSSFTVAGWVYVDSLATTRDIISKFGNSGSREYIVRLATSGAVDFIVATNLATTLTVSSNSAVTVNTWTFIAAGADSSTLKAWISVNAGGKIETAIASCPADSGAAFYLGYRDTTGSYHSGYLDEWGFWKKSLSASELTELYNSGNGKTCCPF